VNKGELIEKQVNNYLAKGGINSLTPIEREPEGYFSHTGCEICNDQMGNTVY
jgi:hypothetical protein